MSRKCKLFDTLVGSVLNFGDEIMGMHQALDMLKNVYQILKEDADINGNYNGKNWAFHIRTILQQHGFDYV